MAYNLRTIRDPLLKQIATALPPDLLWLIYELAAMRGALPPK
jgi:hypothetical protein